MQGTSMWDRNARRGEPMPGMPGMPKLEGQFQNFMDPSKGTTDGLTHADPKTEGNGFTNIAPGGGGGMGAEANTQTMGPSTAQQPPDPRGPTSQNTGGGNIMVQARPGHTRYIQGPNGLVEQTWNGSGWDTTDGGRTTFEGHTMGGFTPTDPVENTTSPVAPVDPADPAGGPPQWFLDWQASQQGNQGGDTGWTNPYAPGGDLYGQFGNFNLGGGAGQNALNNPLYGQGGYFDPNAAVTIPNATEYQSVPWQGLGSNWMGQGFNPMGPYNPMGGGGSPYNMGMPGMPNFQGGNQFTYDPNQAQWGGLGGATSGMEFGPDQQAMADPNARVELGPTNGGGQIARPDGTIGHGTLPDQEMGPYNYNPDNPNWGQDQGGGFNPDTGLNPDADPGKSMIPGQDLTPQQQAQMAQFDQFKELMDPVFARQQEREQQRLANQGLPVTGEAYDAAYGDTLDSQNRAYSQAAWEAVGVGNQEDQRQFQNMMANAGFSQSESQRMFENLFRNQQAGLDDAFRNRGLAVQQYLGLQGNDTQLKAAQIAASAQQSMARAQLAASNARNAAELEMAQMQMQQAQEQFQIAHQFSVGQQSWANAFDDRNWMFNADMQSRNQFFNEMNQFLGTQYAQLGMPNVPLLDATGAYNIGNNSSANAFNAGYDLWNGANQYNAGLFGGLGDLFGAGLGFFGGGN